MRISNDIFQVTLVLEVLDLLRCESPCRFFGVGPSGAQLVG